MLQLIRSQRTMAIASASLAVGVLGSVLLLVAYAIYSGPAAGSTSNGLIRAALWLDFVGWSGLALAVAATVWRLVVIRGRDDLWEVVVAGGSMLLLAVAALAIAVSFGSAGGNVVAAVGYALWAALLVAKAARQSLVEHDRPGERRQSPYWLVAGAGVLVWGAAVGIPDPSVFDSGLAVTKSALAMAGSLAVAVAVLLAHVEGFLGFRRFRLVATALWLVVGGAVTSVIVAAVVFGTPSVDALRIALPFVWLFQVANLSAFAAAAWGQVYDLHGAPSPVGAGENVPGGVRAPGVGPVSPPPPGWYFSPEHGGERWWDGEEWRPFERPGPPSEAPEAGPPTSPP